MVTFEGVLVGKSRASAIGRRSAVLLESRPAKTSAREDLHEMDWE